MTDICEGVDDNFNIKRIVNGLLLKEITLQEAMDAIIWVKAEKLYNRLEKVKDED